MSECGLKWLEITSRISQEDNLRDYRSCYPLLSHMHTPFACLELQELEKLLVSVRVRSAPE